MQDGERVLQKVFILGALIDAAALLPMLFRPLARLMWGLEEMNGSYAFAMRLGAGLMAGWTSLLVWASRRPSERRFVAPLTMQVVLGLMAAEVAAAKAGAADLKKLVPSFVMQVTILCVLGYGYARTGDGAKGEART